VVPRVPGSRQAPSRRLRAVGALAAIGGAALFVWAIRSAGTTAVADGVRRVGPGILLIWLLGGIRGLVRAAAWRLCLGPGHRPGLATMFSAYLAGDAIGNVTPFGLLLSEPSKVFLLRRRIDVPASTAALAVENLFYGGAVIVMLAAGSIAVAAFAVPQPVRIASLTVLASAIAVAGAAGIAAARPRLIGDWFETLFALPIVDRHFRRWLPRLREIGMRIVEFRSRSRGAVLPLVILEASYQLLAVMEIWFALALITGVPPDLLTAFVLECVNRTITVAFQFVPMWLGVDEAGTSLATSILGLGPAAGVTLALVRKARVALWTGIGIAILLQRSARIKAPGDDVFASEPPARPR
jgi:hypothetical protein